MPSMSATANGGTQYDHTGNHLLEFFSKAGSLFTNREHFYGNTTSALELFKSVWRSGDPEISMKLLFWLRDPRGGSGNRSGFRECVSWLCKEAPEWVIANAINIPKYGRWDDMKSLYCNGETSEAAASLWANEILTGNSLAAKWADHEDKHLRRKMYKYAKKILNKRFNGIGDVRRHIAKVRSNVVEVAMTKKEYNDINYSHVPSVAMARYTNAFNRNDAKRFTEYKAQLEKAIETGDTSVKVNAGAIYPHDVIRTLNNGDAGMADMQFKSLPDFMGKDIRIMTIADTSYSMSCRVSGCIRAIDVSQSLALYCSDRLGPKNPFYRKFMQFCSESQITNWSKCKNIHEASKLFNGAVGSTDIAKALNTLLDYAEAFSVTKEQMPNALLIISDMQFDKGGAKRDQETVVNAALQAWVDAGYDKPTIVYWNTDGNAGSPEKAAATNTALVSGFSTSILKSVFNNPENMTPHNVMMDAIKDYDVIIP